MTAITQKNASNSSPSTARGGTSSKGGTSSAPSSSTRVFGEVLKLGNNCPNMMAI
jgi:hypothetical protein